MKKTSTAVARQTKNFRDPKLTIGLDLGDRSSWAGGPSLASFAKVGSDAAESAGLNISRPTITEYFAFPQPFSTACDEQPLLRI